MPLLGAHESVSGGLEKAFDRIESVGGESLQIFTRNQRQWNAAPLSDQEVTAFTNRWQQAGPMEVVSHASYLVNLATNKPDLLVKSIRAFAAELDRCERLQIPYVVLHPGSHGGDGVDAGLERFIKGIDTVFQESDSSTGVLIETTAGQGTGLGSRFEEIGIIISESKFSDRIGVCIDTCHIFAAGYDIRTTDGYSRTFDEFDRHIGLKHIKFFHLNDSKKELGSRVDRHTHIGQGHIGLNGFANLLNDPRFSNYSMTLETPKGDNLAEDRQNLEVLRGLITG